jgi:hypothetical protein
VNYLYGSLRLDYKEVPFAKKLGARCFASLEGCYYPKEGKSGLGETRASLGAGINVPINEMLNISLYHNFANFGSRPGDIEKNSYINFTF